MSRVRNDNDFIDMDASDSDQDSGADEPESDDMSVDSEAGPSSPRLKRLKRAPGGGNGRKAKEPVVKSGVKVIGKGKGKGKAWEGALQHTWDSLREDEEGSLAAAMSDALMGPRAKR